MLSIIKLHILQEPDHQTVKGLGHIAKKGGNHIRFLNLAYAALPGILLGLQGHRLLGNPAVKHRHLRDHQFKLFLRLSIPIHGFSLRSQKITDDRILLSTVNCELFFSFSFCILPLGVLGRESLISTSWGTLKWAKCSRQNKRISSAGAERVPPLSASCFRTTKALTVSPRSLSGIPTTAAS